MGASHPVSDRSQNLNSRRAISAVAATGAACAVGVIAAGLPATVLVSVTAALAGLVLVLLARHYVRAGDVADAIEVAPSPPRPLATRAGAGVGVAAPARYLYFAGMLAIGQTTVRPVLGLTLSDWLFFAALCAVLCDMAVRPQPLSLRMPWLIILGVALFVVSGMLSSVGALEPLQSAARVARFGYLTLAWFWVGTAVLTSWRDVRIATGCWVTSIAVDGLAAVLQARGVAVPFLGPIMWGRMTGLMEHVNDLGGAAGVALVPAFVLALTARRLRGIAYWCLALAGVIAALLLSGSVSGMAAGAVAVLVWLVLASRGVRPVVLVATALVVAVGVVQLQTGLGLPTPLQRLLTATGRSDGGQLSTISTRVEGYDNAWAALGDGGWTGAGLDTESGYIGPGVEVHDVFLKAWYEAGWFALIGMLLVVAGALGYGLAAARRAPLGRPRLISLAAFSAVVAFVALAMSAPILHQRYGWVSVALAVACMAVARAGAETSADLSDDE
jgi:O-antigen ligase